MRRWGVALALLLLAGCAPKPEEAREPVTVYEIRCANLIGERVVGSTVGSLWFNGRRISWFGLDGLRRHYLASEGESCIVEGVAR